MSYKAMADCLFEVSTQLPHSQELIQQYLPRGSIVENQTSLRELTHTYQQKLGHLGQLTRGPKEGKKEAELRGDLGRLEGFLQGTQDWDEVQENVKSDWLRNLVTRVQKTQSESLSRELKKEVILLQKQNQRLMEKVSLGEKALAIKKSHLQEYLGEVE